MCRPLLGGRLHWASTEASAEFTGYMEGAVRAGEAAAAAIVASMRAAPGSATTAEASAPTEHDGAGWAWCGSGVRDGM